MARQRDSYAVFALWTSRLPSVARRSAADEAFVQNAAVLLDADLELGSTLGRLCMKHVIEDLKGLRYKLQMIGEPLPGHHLCGVITNLSYSIGPDLS